MVEQENYGDENVWGLLGDIVEAALDQTPWLATALVLFICYMIWRVARWKFKPRDKS